MKFAIGVAELSKIGEIFAESIEAVKAEAISAGADPELMSAVQVDFAATMDRAFPHSVNLSSSRDGIKRVLVSDEPYERVSPFASVPAAAANGNNVF